MLKMAVERSAAACAVSSDLPLGDAARSKTVTSVDSDSGRHYDPEQDASTQTEHVFRRFVVEMDSRRRRNSCEGDRQQVDLIVGVSDDVQQSPAASASPPTTGSADDEADNDDDQLT